MTEGTSEILGSEFKIMLERIASSNPIYSSLLKKNVTTHPIPFFGRILQASVATVGVNPSATEFQGRNWPENLDWPTLCQRLEGYFSSRVTPPHPWFDGWEKAFAFLGVSYQDGSAAHLDLSPRATISMGSVQDQRLFAEMIAEDIHGFFRILPLLRNLKLLLIAGCVTKRWYISDFIKKHSVAHGYNLVGTSEKSGPGRVGYLTLIGSDISLPVFFCSVSPSSRNYPFLVERIAMHSRKLKTLIHGTP